MTEFTANPPSASNGAAPAPDPDFQAVVARLVGAAAESLTFEALSGGVSSDIWRVGHGTTVFCAKRALPRLRVAALWEAPVSRNAEEVRWLRTARRFIGAEVAEVIAHDAAAGVALLAWYPPDTWRNWKQLLLTGAVNADIGTALGTALGRIVTTSARDPALAAEFDNSALFDALRIDPFFRHIETRFEGMAALVHDLQQSRSALVHGDFSPKNILVDEDGRIRILDAETATWGPAAFDPGYLIAHLLLKFERMPDPRLVDTAGRFWSAYTAATQSIAGTAAAPTDRDVVRVIAGMLLARIDGKSPVDYLTENNRKTLRARAADLLAQSTVTQDAHATVHDLLLRWRHTTPKSS